MNTPPPISILHICKMTGVAGTENHLLTLLPGLAKRGLNIHLWVLTEPDKPLTDYLAEMRGRGVPAEGIPIHKDVELPLIGQLAARIRALAPAAVHTHLIHADWHGIPAARRAGVKRIFTSGHNDDQFRRRPAIRLIQAYLWRRLTAGIAISEAVRQFMIRVEFAPPRKVHTVHYGLDPAPTEGRIERIVARAEWGLSADQVVIGSVCRLIEQKGLPYGLRAFKAVADRFPQVRYVLIGDGPLRGALQQEAESLGVADKVIFAGWQADAPIKMHAFDIFLMPSLWEGFGLVMLEAMAARLPIVASRVSALPEICQEGQTGFLAPPGDVATLTEKLSALVGDPALRAAFGAAGRARLESAFSTAKMIESTLGVYRAGGL